MAYWFPNKITVYRLLAIYDRHVLKPGTPEHRAPPPPPGTPPKPSVLKSVLKALVSASNHKHKDSVEL